MKPSRWILLLSLFTFLPNNLDGAKSPARWKSRSSPHAGPQLAISHCRLETVNDKRILPIWIDIPEARAIASSLNMSQRHAP